MPGGMEMMVILLIVILLFGANKLPKLARSTGEAMGEFKKGREDIEREIQEAANGVEQRDEEYETEHTDDETTA
nr:twin-arginine translocase TatA/TatE family subunit [Halorussus halophilus]